MSCRPAGTFCLGCQSTTSGMGSGPNSCGITDWPMNCLFVRFGTNGFNNTGAVMTGAGGMAPAQGSGGGIANNVSWVGLSTCTDCCNAMREIMGDDAARDWMPLSEPEASRASPLGNNSAMWRVSSPSGATSAKGPRSLKSWVVWPVLTVAMPAVSTAFNVSPSSAARSTR